MYRVKDSEVGMDSRIKRYIMRLRGSEPSSVRDAVGDRIRADGIRMRIVRPPPVDTPIELQIHYGNGRVALAGYGWVSSVDGLEAQFELEWTDQSDPGVISALFADRNPPLKAIHLAELEVPEEVPLVPAWDTSSLEFIHPDLGWALAQVPDDDRTERALRPRELEPQASIQAEDTSTPLPETYIEDLEEYTSTDDERRRRERDTSSLTDVAESKLETSEPLDLDLSSDIFDISTFNGHSEAARRPSTGPLVADLGAAYIQESTAAEVPTEPIHAFDARSKLAESFLPETPLALTDILEQIEADLAAHALESQVSKPVEDDAFELDSDAIELEAEISGIATIPPAEPSLTPLPDASRPEASGRTTESRDPSTDQVSISSLGGREIPLPEPRSIEGENSDLNVLPVRSDPTGPVLAIDIGTSTTIVAVAQGGDEARVLRLEDQSASMPSVVALVPNGTMIAGVPALRALARDPSCGVVGVRRLLGRSFWTASVQRLESQLGWTPVAGTLGHVCARVGGRDYSLEFIVAELVRRGVARSVQDLGTFSNRAVLTCPTYYGARQRAALMNAAEQAGVYVEAIVSSCLAAAVHQVGANYRGPPRKLCVLSLAAGALEVALIKVQPRAFEVLSSGGNALLGGIDFDAAAVRLLANSTELSGVTTQELLESPEVVQRVDSRIVDDEAALWAKALDIALSMIRDVCRRGGVGPADVDQVLIIGGRAHGPDVLQRFEDFFKKPCQTLEGTVVALGAAEIGRSLQLDFDRITVLDRIASSVVLGTPGGRVRPIIPRDAPFPAFGETRFQVRPNAPRELLLFEGDHAHIEGCEPFGRLCLDGLEDIRTAPSILDIRMCIGEAGGVDTQVIDVETSASVAHRLDPFLPPEHIARMISDASNEASLSDPSRGRGFMDWLKKKLLL